MSDKIYITVTGTQHYLGNDFLKKDVKLRLIKEPDNAHDREAIRVEMEGLGKIGYVANSTFTVLGECFSAGRLYDRIGSRAVARVKHVLPKGVICAVRQKDLLWQPPQSREENDEVSF
ncbi:MAG: HIRAN domain-containing protein [Clostridia bacterium]|nr:HIRAN domain-containing protein [Clostridia bacterium]